MIKNTTLGCSIDFNCMVDLRFFKIYIQRNIYFGVDSNNSTWLTDLENSINISETKLIEEYQQSGKQRLVGKLFEPYLELLYGVCLKYLKDPALAQDAVMDVYVHVSEKLKTHEVDTFRPWLYVVAKNHCMEKLRKSSRRLSKEKVAFDMYTENVFHPDNGIKEDLLTKMESCMEKLNVEQKQCLSAFYYQSKSYKIIAEEQGIAWNKVRSNIQNGRLKLKNCMDSKTHNVL